MRTAERDNEVIETAAQWWADSIDKTKLSNNDPDSTEGRFELFKNSIVESVSRVIDGSGFQVMYLKTDGKHNPDCVIKSAADKAGIEYAALPWFSEVRMNFRDGEVSLLRAFARGRDQLYPKTP